MNKIYYLFILLILATGSGFAAKKPMPRDISKENRLSEADNRRFKYYFYEGLRFKENQQYDQALEAFRLCVELDSLDAGVRSEVGMLYASVGLNAEAVQNMEAAVRLQPRNWWYSIRLISLFSELKQWDKAIVVTNKIQEFYPNKPEVYNILATLYKETKNFPKAIAAFDRLESITGIDQSLSFEKFRLYVMSGKPKKGIAEIDRLINKFPTESRYKVLRGDIFLQQKMPAKAFEIYQQVLREDPKNAYVYVSLSEYYKSVNQENKALESIVSALKSEQLDVDTKMEVLGQYVEKIVQDSTKLVETEGLFKLLVDRYPLEEQVHGYYAVYLQFTKRNAEAIVELETMSGINPKNEQTWLRLIQLHFTDRNFKELVAVTDRAISHLPKLSTWYFYRGIAQFQMEDYRAALATYQTGLPFIGPDQPTVKSDFYAQIADIYFKLEKKDSAYSNYEKALAANPQNIMVMNNYAYYLSLEKAELKKAERMSAKTVELEPKNSTYLDTYAWILYQQENYSLAKFYIERAMDNLKKGEEPGVILEHYGDILWMSGKGNVSQEAKAVEMWQKSYDSGNKTGELLKKIEDKGMVPQVKP